MNRSWKALGSAAALVVAGAALAAPLRANEPARDSDPLESPGFDEDCYEFTYPKKDACGSLSGITECKSSPTIDASDDEAKKEACQPTKGDICFCE